MTNPHPVALPDFRRIGVQLRIVLLVEGTSFLSAYSNATNLAESFEVYASRGSLLEPVLLSTLLALYAISPRLLQWRYRFGCAAIITLALGITMAWHLGFGVMLEQDWTDGLLRNLVLASAITTLTLAYLNWRHRALSPALSEARLSALQSRIRPHFLFNSLNTVLSLIRPDPRRAELVLENLADLFRALMADPRNLVPLERELDLTRAYLEIEGIRLGDRLKVTWQCGEGLEHVAVPQLLLQPLVENAVVHGIEPSAAPGVIQIEISARGKQLVISVSNSLPKDNATGGELRPGNHMALDNIRERLDLHFDAEANMRQAIQDGQFVVRVEMPLNQLSRRAPGALGRDGSLSR